MWHARTAVLLICVSAALAGAGVEAGPRTPSRQTVAPAANASAKVWEGRNEEFEAFIATAPVDRFEDIPLGVTHPRRAFFKTLPVEMTHVDRALWTRMLSLDETTLAAALGKWVDGRCRRALLARRDRMKVVIEAMVKYRGEQAVFPRP